MKFLPTVTLDGETFTRLIRNELILQAGQWVRIPGDSPGVKSKPSRFVAAHRGYVNVCHPDGPHATGKVRMQTFKRRCAAK